jgi:ABC-type antimicrobial peptide transport system permease subunit
LAVGIGTGVGFAIAFSASSLVRGMLYGIEPSDPISLAAAPVLMLLAVMLATWIPTRRALRVDAVVSLRED